MIFLILGFISALFICLQFQVSRNSMLFMAVIAMCNASSKALFGTQPSFINSLANAIAVSFS